jgi:hypothetical protein
MYRLSPGTSFGAFFSTRPHFEQESWLQFPVHLLDASKLGITLLQLQQIRQKYSLSLMDLEAVSLGGNLDSRCRLSMMMVKSDWRLFEIVHGIRI